MLRLSILAGCLMLIAAIGTSCGGKPKAPALSPDKIIATSGQMPDWVTDARDAFTREGMQYFRGRALQVTDATLGLSQAEADAKKRIAASISDTVLRELSSSQLGDNKTEGGVGFFTQDDVTTATMNVTISGVMPVESYWEQRVDSETQMRYHNCHALVSISDQDLRQARARAMQGLAEIARKRNNQKAEEAVLEIKRKLESGGMSE